MGWFGQSASGFLSGVWLDLGLLAHRLEQDLFALSVCFFLIVSLESGWIWIFQSPQSPGQGLLALCVCVFSFLNSVSPSLDFWLGAGWIWVFLASTA